MRTACKKCGSTSGPPKYDAASDVLRFTCICGFEWTRDPVDKAKPKHPLLTDFADPARNANTGHGHVYPRPDGMKMRCGGPAMCCECGKDLARRESETRLASINPPSQEESQSEYEARTPLGQMLEDR